MGNESAEILLHKKKQQPLDEPEKNCRRRLLVFWSRNVRVPLALFRMSACEMWYDIDIAGRLERKKSKSMGKCVWKGARDKMWWLTDN